MGNLVPESKADEGGKKRHYPEEIKTAAKGMYLRHYAVSEISDTLSVPSRTIYSWASIEQWDNLLAHEGKEESLSRRMVVLVEKDTKTAVDLKEIELIISSLERLQNMRLKEAKKRENEAGGDDGQSEKLCIPGPQKKGRRVKNDVSHLTPADFENELHKHYFDYQHQLRLAQVHRNRLILKSRQIGFTWYLAQERFEKACLTGYDQIFLSATRAQSEIFRDYIIQIAEDKFNIELKGNPLVLHTNHGKTTLRFLATSSRSAQSYHGDVVMDEIFWIMKFSEFFKVASGMASHAKWSKTLGSTPSALFHEAYKLWGGANFQKRFKSPKPWPSQEELKSGILCPDSWYRQIITLSDAIKGGCNLFDVKQLKLEYSPEEYRQLFECEFIDDTQSVYGLELLMQCMEDPALWKMVKNAYRPVGNLPVWGGYDPSRTGDDASFVVLLPPQKAGDKFRIIARYKWIGQSYIWQAGQIKELCSRYNFVHIGIDTTGPGIGVFEHVKKFCPYAVSIHYSMDIKARLVLKALEVMLDSRLAWDAAESDIAHAFLTIRQEATASGLITYAASRSLETGHADVAWAIMHALSKEALADKTEINKSFVSV